MRRPPQWTEARRYPATAGTWMLALMVTVAWWAGMDVSRLFEDPYLARGQLWRLFTSALLHSDPIHLAFNLYWLWVFGTLVEQHLGPLRTFAILSLLAAGSGAAEFAFLDGGVGLSGVGYGLFGLLWVLGRKDSRFADAVDANTLALFVAWFVLCIVLTAGDVWRVANIAHGVGAALGAGVGWAMTLATPARYRAAALLGAGTVGLIACATVARPYVNVSPDRGVAEANLGYEAAMRNQPREAIRWYRVALSMNPSDATSWYNLGIALAELNQSSEAAAAYARAAALEPDNEDFKTAREEMDTYLREVSQHQP